MEKELQKRVSNPQRQNLFQLPPMGQIMIIVQPQIEIGVDIFRYSGRDGGIPIGIDIINGTKV